MAAADNDSALVCRKGGFQIRPMFELLEGQCDGSVYRVYRPLNTWQWQFHHSVADGLVYGLERPSMLSWTELWMKRQLILTLVLILLVSFNVTHNNKSSPSSFSFHRIHRIEMLMCSHIGDVLTKFNTSLRRLPAVLLAVKIEPVVVSCFKKKPAGSHPFQ